MANLINSQIPICLYIHLPWCVRKCPYCDFNSHAMPATLPEDLYIQSLLDELDMYLELINERTFTSIFFGGGTPSLFSPNGIKKILDGIKARLALQPNVEITLEANPGTIDYVRFQGFREAGINRLSLGIQSMQNEKLNRLGRIHDKTTAQQAISMAKEAGFDNFNLDIMYGLPEQTLQEALDDLQIACSFQPAHFSWYQLTIEPNTAFYHTPPTLPDDEMIWEMQVKGQAMLTKLGFNQYEVSAYAQREQRCKHNLNYWEFGDYLGIGAGAHSKLTNLQNGEIKRIAQCKHPKDYLLQAKRHAPATKTLTEKDLIFEFMLNALRLADGINPKLFLERTGIKLETVMPSLQQAERKGLLELTQTKWLPTLLGKKFLNDLVGMFL